MANARIFVFAPEEEGTIGDSMAPLVAAGCEIIQGRASWHDPRGDNEAEMCAFAENADALMGTSIRTTPITRRVMESSERLRIVAKYTIGFDDVDVEAATELGVLVTHSPTEANWGGVAEGTMAMMLTLLKKVRERDAAMKQGRWRHRDLVGRYVGARVQDGFPGLTIGIVGFGRIGRRLAALLAPWRVRILACDPYVEPARFALHNVIECDLETLLASADVVSLHVTLNHTSHRLIDSAALRRMKPTAVLINTARGEVVDEGALVEALDQGIIAGAALDVFEHEPLAALSPLRRFDDRVLLSAHMVSFNEGGGIRPGTFLAARCVDSALRGEVPHHVVNPDVLPRWRQRFGAKPLI